jgi:hypothetical protein
MNSRWTRSCSRLRDFFAAIYTVLSLYSGAGAIEGVKN